MELKKVIENLEIKSDINNLTTEEFIEKYSSSKESYEKFVKVLSRIFVGRQLYPIMISNMYQKIINTINSARLSGVSKDVSDAVVYENAILEEINYHQNQTIFDIHGEDYCQAHALFESSIGATKAKNDKNNFASRMKKMYKCALVAQSDSTLSASKFGETVGTLRALNLSEEECRNWLEAYYRENPKAQLCCDINFLYLANYVFRSHPSAVTEDFVELIKSVSSITLMAHNEIAPNDFSIDDYKRVLKKVNQNINDFENKQEKENKQKRKIKDFFDRKRPN